MVKVLGALLLVVDVARPPRSTGPRQPDDAANASRPIVEIQRNRHRGVAGRTIDLFRRLVESLLRWDERVW